jgi:hypothetical protein
MKIWLGDINAKARREDIFKLTKTKAKTEVYKKLIEIMK